MIRFSLSLSSLLDGGLRQAIHRKCLVVPVRSADFEAIAKLGDRATRRQAVRSTARGLAYIVALQVLEHVVDIHASGALAEILAAGSRIILPDEFRIRRAKGAVLT